MNNQLEMIFPAARKSDPETSKLAGININFRAGSQRAMLLNAYFHADERGLTDEEAGMFTGLVQKRGCCYWKRSSELRQLHLIEPTGDTRRSLAGQEQQVCVITADGKEVIETLRKEML
jgi:hypothetical protein